METTTITYSFVRVSGEPGTHGLLGIVLGFVSAEWGIRVRVFDLNKKSVSVVSLEDCRLVPHSNIWHGVTSLWANHSEFGDGIIIFERRPRDVLEVQLQKIGGAATSNWLPFTEVTVFGPRPA